MVLMSSIQTAELSFMGLLLFEPSDIHALDTAFQLYGALTLYVRIYIFLNIGGSKFMSNCSVDF